MEKDNRNYLLDIARIFAIFAVTMIHCCSNFIEEYEQTSAEFIFGNLFDSAVRFAVPFFLMISGALFLDEHKEFTLKNMLSKYVKKIVILTLVWAIIYSLVYNVIIPLSSGSVLNIENVVKGILSGYYHMWYLYMIIGLYIITPFIKLLVCQKNRKIVFAYIIITLLIQFFKPIFDMLGKSRINLFFVNNWIDTFYMDFFSGYVAYFLAGWYIIHVGLTKKEKGIIYVLGALSLIAIFLSVQITKDYNNGYSNLNIFVFMYSVSGFLALNNAKITLKEKSKKYAVALSKLTFGSYIVHILVLTAFETLFPYKNMPALYILVSTITVVSVSFLISYVLSKIPVLRKIIKL